MIKDWEAAYAGGGRADAVSIFKAGLDRADPLLIMKTCLSLEGDLLKVSSGDAEANWNLSAFDRILLVGYGKASARMALGVEALLGERIAGGLVVTKWGHGEALSRARLVEASHPVPDASSVEGARLLIELARRANETTLVINCVSGGGSALLCAPGFGLDLEEKRSINSLLLASGAPIGAMNCVRKHLSAVKGGRLAKALFPATSINLILSDVMGDDLATIASGPTAPDSGTWKDAIDALVNYHIYDKLPPRLRATFDEGLAGKLEDTPKPGDPVFERCHNILIGTNYLSLLAAEMRARKLGYSTLICSARLEGEAGELGRSFAKMASDLRKGSLAVSAPACVVAGGESTVTLKGSGKGGRNQEMALAFLDAAIDEGVDLDGLCFLSGATDGNDGPTDAAGGFADALALKACRRSGLDIKAALANNDSYHILGSSESLLVTGPTNTNVCDLQILVLR